MSNKRNYNTNKPSSGGNRVTGKSSASVEAKKGMSFGERISDFFQTVIKPMPKKAGAVLKEKRYLYPSFFIPVIALFITYAFMGIYPFGEKTILTCDMNGQYVYFFEQLRDILTGDASLLYTFERSLGGEFFGYYTYYLASPLSILVAIFPKKMITEAILVIMILKSGLAGLTFSIYLDKTKKKNPLSFTMFSVMYALSSYMIFYQWDLMWMDAVVWLPLIVLGIESLIKEGKFKLFTISLAIAVWSNYYIGYMLCIFVALYFLFYIIAHPTNKINYLNEKYHLGKSLGRIALFSAIALMMAATMIFTAYYSLQFGKSDFLDSNKSPDLRLDLLNLFAKMFIGSFDTIRLEGTPNIYAGTLILFLIPIYFISKKITMREKITYSVFCLIFILSFSINTLDLVWHGFQMPIWMNYRYSFLFIFIVLTMAYKGFERLDEVNLGFIGKIVLFLIFMLMVIQKTVKLTRYEGEKVEVMPSYEMIWLSILFILAYFIIFLVQKRTNYRHVSAILLTVVVCIEAFAGSLIGWSVELSDGGYASRQNYRDFADKIEATSTELYQKDPTPFFRVDKTYVRKGNDNLVGDFNGVSEFTSTFNAKAHEFLKNLGMETSAQASQYMYFSEISDSILGIKYIIGEQDENGKLKKNVSPLYKSYTDSQGLIISENPYALPLAYGVDSGIKNVTLNKYNSKYDSVNYFFSGMLGESFYKPCVYALDENGFSNIKNIVKENNNVTSYKSEDDTKSAYFTFTIVPSYDGDVYMHLPSPYTTAASCIVNGEVLEENLYEYSDQVYNLGYFTKGSEITVRLKFQHYRLCLYTNSTYFYQIEGNNYAATLKTATDKLKANGLNITEFTDTNIHGTLNASKDMTVFSTIPYDKCWKVYVDGERVETFMLIDSMLGFDISKGEHEIEFKYSPSYYYAGIAVGIAGIALFIVACILDKIYRKNIVITVPPEEDDDEDDDKNKTKEGKNAISSKRKS